MQQLPLLALITLNSALILLSQVALWQRKEYRFDRIRAYLASPEGSISHQYIFWVSALLLLLAYILPFPTLVALASIFSITIGHALRISKKGLVRPDPTFRALLVLVLSAVLTLCIFFFVGLSDIRLLATILVFLPVIVWLSVVLVGIPAQFQKKRVVRQAMTYRRHLQHLQVVGITGSVGKTSTKTYLIHLLGGESESIVATKEHRNSPYSVAQDMLTRLSQQTSIYIAEMGAYVKGEIAELCRLAQPKIGIVTAITNQHVGLFGSLEILAKTKWELVNALPSDGVAILNKDDATIREHARYLSSKVLWFSIREVADIYTKDILLHDENLECTIVIGDQEQHLTLPLVSTGQLIPALAAIAGALALGVETELITRRLQDLPSLPRTMELRRGSRGTHIVDDSYSASEASVANAIEYLSRISSTDKRLVLVPIIELGSEGKGVHERIGKLLASLKANVYIYGDAYKEDLQKGLGTAPFAAVFWYTDAGQMNKAVMEDANSNTTIVLEGRIPSLIRSSLL